MRTNNNTLKTKLKRIKTILVLLILLAYAGIVFSQSSATNKKLFTRAEQALARTDYSTALNLFSQVLESEPENYEAMSHVGVCSFNLKDRKSVV